MKQIILSTIFAFALLSTAPAQQIEQVQRTLITKKTASWCPKCGDWGWTMFEGLLEQNEAKAVLFAAHYSGDLTSSTASAITDNFGGPGQPIFYLNETDQFVNSGNVPAKLVAAKAAVDANFELDPVANTGIDATLENGNLNIKTKTRFFQAAEGKFYLGIYILENNLVSYQAGLSNTAVHQKVLLSAVTAEHFGELIADGIISMNTEIDRTYTYEMPAGLDKEDTEIAAVIWQKVGNEYNVVNTYAISDIGLSTDTEEVLNADWEMRVRTSAAGQIEVDIQLNSPQQNMQLQLLDMNGRSVQQLAVGNYTLGRHIFELPSGALPSGIYLLHLSGEEGQLTRKVLVQ